MKTTTIQIFLLHHMASGSGKTVAVICPTSRQAKAFITDVIRAMVMPESGVKYTKFSDERIDFKVGQTGLDSFVWVVPLSASASIHKGRAIVIYDDVQQVQEIRDGQTIVTFDSYQF